MANISGSVLKIQKPNKEYIDFPMRYIRAGTYQFTDSGQDLDSYRDCDGELHRTALAHRLIKVEFSCPTMPLSDYQAMFKYFSSNYTNVEEKKLHIRAYQYSEGVYKEADVYVPDWTEQPYVGKKDGTDWVMSETRVALIQY